MLRPFFHWNKIGDNELWVPTVATIGDNWQWSVCSGMSPLYWNRYGWWCAVQGLILSDIDSDHSYAMITATAINEVAPLVHFRQQRHPTVRCDLISWMGVADECCAGTCFTTVCQVDRGAWARLRARIHQDCEWQLCEGLVDTVDVAVLSLIERGSIRALPLLSGLHLMGGRSRADDGSFTKMNRMLMGNETYLWEHLLDCCTKVGSFSNDAMQTVVWTHDGVFLAEQIQQLIMSIDLDPWCPTPMGVSIRLWWKSKSQSLSVAALWDGSEGVGRNNVFVLRNAINAL